jgi:hypothetical protein
LDAQPAVEGVGVGRIWVERAASGIELLAVTLIVLGLLVVIRTFLSWSLVVELDGHWPWQESRKRAAENETNGAAI